MFHSISTTNRIVHDIKLLSTISQFVSRIYCNVLHEINLVRWGWWTMCSESNAKCKEKVNNPSNCFLLCVFRKTVSRVFWMRHISFIAKKNRPPHLLKLPQGVWNRYTLACFSYQSMPGPWIDTYQRFLIVVCHFCGSKNNTYCCKSLYPTLQLYTVQWLICTSSMAFIPLRSLWHTCY